MKKVSNLLIAMLMALSVSVTLTGCSDDEPKSSDKEMKEATILTSLYVNQSMLDTYNIVGKSFLGQDLKFSTTPVNIKLSGETIPMYAMELEGTSNAVPFISIMNVTFTIKDGYQVPDKSDFAISLSAQGTIKFTDSSEDTFTASGYTMHNNGVFGDKIAEYTELLNKRFGRIKVTLDSNGIDIDSTSDE